MKWRGTKPIVIGTCDDDGKPIEKFVVHPGEEIPPEAEQLLKEAEMVYGVPQDDPLDMAEVERLMKLQ